MKRLLLLPALIFSLLHSSMAQEFDILVWADECDGTGMIDTSKWFHQTLLPNGTSWYNNEIQHYTDRIENTYLEDGYMYIMAKNETYTDQGVTKEYTSARLNSKFAFTYGRVEVRAKLPFGVGTWPAIWMLGKNISEPGAYWVDEFGTTGWPACGEIDIMEHWGTNQNYVSSAMHTPSSFGGTVNVGGRNVDDVSGTFHVYAMEWSEDKIVFTIDDIEHYTYEPETQNDDTWPFYKDQYILLNIAILESISSSFTESPMVIDYVRVYEASAPTGNNELDGDEMLVYPNPANDALNVTVPSRFVGGNYSIRSITGVLIREDRVDDASLSLDTSDIDAGVYFVNVESDLGERMVRRFVVQ